MGKASVSQRALVENEVNSATYMPTPNGDTDDNVFFRQGSNGPIGGGSYLQEFFWQRTALEKTLIILQVLTFILLIILVLAFTFSTNQVSRKQEKQQNLCLSETCVRIAGEILSKMNKSVDPCSDFYTYSCGRWITETIPPSDYGIWNAFQELSEQVKLKSKQILDDWGTEMGQNKEGTQKNSKLLDSQAKSYTFYKSCGSDMRETIGPAPMLDILKAIGGSTIFEDNEDIAKIPFRETDTKMNEQLGGSFFYEFAVFPKNSNTTQNILTSGPRTDLTLGHFSVYQNLTKEDPRYLAFLYAVEQSLTLLARTLDYTVDDAMEERIKLKASQIVQLEIAFSTTITDMDTMNMMATEDTYLITDLAELKSKVPQANWEGVLNNRFNQVDIQITDQEPIQLLDPGFFDEVGKFIQQSNTEVLQNYQYWKVVDISMNNINEDYERVKANLTLKVKGSNSGFRPRWEKCVNILNSHSIIGNVIGADFIHKYFNPSSKGKIQAMIESIRTAFVESLPGLGWLDEDTRSYAVQKANKMKDFFAFPDNLLNKTYVGSLLHGVEFDEDTFYANILKLQKFSSMEEMKKLRKPVDKSEWEMTPQTINAYYVPAANSFTFPAGILQKPFYSDEYPMSFNYGGIGVVVGHELTHGFDTQGRTYDAEGNQIEWFKNETAMKFQNLSQCFVDQYSKYTIYDLHVDGVLTLGENIADNGGIKSSFKAYQDYVRENGEELLYPGLDMSHEQIFFLAFGQMWCNIVSEESARYRVESDSHTPEQLRVPGAVSNLEEFAEAFNCPRGSPMNPKTKCEIW